MTVERTVPREKLDGDRLVSALEGRSGNDDVAIDEGVGNDRTAGRDAKEALGRGVEIENERTVDTFQFESHDCRPADRFTQCMRDRERELIAHVGDGAGSVVSELP